MYFSSNGVARMRTKDWNITRFAKLWEPGPESNVRRWKYLIITNEDWISGGFSFEVLYREGLAVGDEEGDVGAQNIPEILGLDMGWWGLNPYKKFEKGGDDELLKNWKGWKGMKEDWVFYMWGKSGRRSWGTPECREG
jgi:hypothetical protein